MIAPRMCNPMGASVCETCAERGRPNEPVYKMGMCEFCFKGLRHPKATREELAKERGRERPDRCTSSPQKRKRGGGDSSLCDRVKCPKPHTLAISNF